MRGQGGEGEGEDKEGRGRVGRARRKDDRQKIKGHSGSTLVPREACIEALTVSVLLLNAGCLAVGYLS